MDGKPAMHEDGYYAVSMTYDEAGNVVQETYLDADGQRINQKNGYAALLRTYDEDGEVLTETRLDLNGNEQE